MVVAVDRLIQLYSSARHTEVIGTVDLETFMPLDDPIRSKIVAASLFQLGDFQQCFSLLSSLESCFSGDAEYLSMFGACCRRLGDFGRAKALLEKALSLDPESLQIKNNLANLLIDTGDFDLAKKLLDQVLSLDPNYEDARLNARRLALKSGTAQAQDASIDQNVPRDTSFSFSDPLLLAFSDEEVQKHGRMNIKTEADNINKSLINTLPELSPLDTAADQIQLAYAACKEGRYDFALKLCSEAKRLLPELPTPFECASDVYIAMQRFTAAEICLLQALSLGSKCAKLFINLSSLSCMRRDFDMAEIYCQRAFLIDSSSKHAQALMSQIANGRSNESSDCFTFNLTDGLEIAQKDLTKKQTL